MLLLGRESVTLYTHLLDFTSGGAGGGFAGGRIEAGGVHGSDRRA